MSSSAQTQGPSPIWTLLEGRWVFEFGSFYTVRPLLKRLPKGDGHPVIVLPGFLASQFSTRPMRSLLKDLGYEPYDWGLGRNLRFNDHREAEMFAMLKRVYLRHGRKVSLVGWSLGGVFARELAKTRPEFVRQVITLGSPLSGPDSASSAKRLFERINGKPSLEMQHRFKTLGDAPPVPTTSVYTKTDGIVDWRGSVQAKSAQTENIEIPASHLGIGVNPLAMYIIADRLRQREGEWQPFEKEGLKRHFFKSPPTD